MRNLRHLILLAFVLNTSIPTAVAAIYYRDGVITKVSSESNLTSPSRAVYQGTISIIQGNPGAPWTPAGSTCSNTWVYFDAQSNPQFTAMVISARISGMNLQVVVDDSLPKQDGFCQVIDMSI